MADTPNLIFSARAVEKLRAVMDAEQDSADVRLRVTVLDEDGDTRFGFSLERSAKEDDAVIEFGLIEVLVDAASAPALDGSEVDYIDDDEGERFVVRSQQPGW